MKKVPAKSELKPKKKKTSARRLDLSGSESESEKDVRGWFRRSKSKTKLEKAQKIDAKLGQFGHGRRVLSRVIQSSEGGDQWNHRRREPHLEGRRVEEAHWQGLCKHDSLGYYLDS